MKATKILTATACIAATLAITTNVTHAQGMMPTLPTEAVLSGVAKVVTNDLADGIATAVETARADDEALAETDAAQHDDAVATVESSDENAEASSIK